MAKYHVNKETGRANICRAEKQCPLGADTPHFDNKQDAKAYVEKNEAQNNDTFTTVSKVNAKKITAKNRVGNDLKPKVSELRAQVKANAKDVVSERAKNNNIILENANPERAQKRLEEAVEFANERKNVHLMEKLSTAKVLPSGSFKLANGTRFNTDQMLDRRTAIKHVEAQRAELNNALTEFTRENKIPVGSKATAKTDDGTFSITVNDGGFDEESYNKLPENIRAQMMKLENDIDIDLIREKISPQKQAEMMTKTQVIDYIIGKPHNINQEAVKANTHFEGATNEEKMQDGANKVAALYSNAKDTFGKTQKQLNAESAIMTDAVKAAASQHSPNQNTFVPARSQSNGAIVTGRENISRKKAYEILTKEEIQSVTVVNQVPDKEKAKSILSPAEYDKIFNARRVSIRATEK